MKKAQLKSLRQRAPKYRAKPQTVDGLFFASKKEAARYRQLKLLKRAGTISALRCQVVFNLSVNSIHICRYVADFVYFDNEQNERIVEDTKGFLTKEYKIKRKLMKAIIGIEIKET